MLDARIIGPDLGLGRAVLFIELVWRDRLLGFIQDLDLGICLCRCIAGGIHIIINYIFASTKSVLPKAKS